MKKVGIITFHNSYNCGSMLESYAMQREIELLGYNAEIVNFSTIKQRKMYYHWFEPNCIKNILKNIIILPHIKKIKYNNKKYEEFKRNYFNLTDDYKTSKELCDSQYSTVVSGSDQIWNTTIDDFDDAYFLNWAKNARKVAYAPSFGAKRIKDYNSDTEYQKYCNYIKAYDALSIRENNGKNWLKEMIGADVPVLIDPTLLLEKKEYEKLLDKDINEKKYIFFYCPSYHRAMCEYVQKIAKKYNLKVICWSSKSFYIKRVKKYGFELAKYENPSAYLSYIKNAELVVTGSFHGTIFSTIFRKRFMTIYKDTFGSDDRTLTLVQQLGLEDRYVDCIFDDKYNYLEDVDYSQYDIRLPVLQENAKKFLCENIK